MADRLNEKFTKKLIIDLNNNANMNLNNNSSIINNNNNNTNNIVSSNQNYCNQ